MKEISLKRSLEKIGEEQIAKSPKEVYPSFSVYEKTPEELLKLTIGTECMARVKLSSKDIHEGDTSRNSVGFDVISIVIKDQEAIKKLMEEVKLPKKNQNEVLEKY